MSRIFHLVTPDDWAAGAHDGVYTPRRFALDGFVHCTGDEAVTIQVAEAYFAEAPAVLAVELSVDALTAPVRWEAPAPLAGAQPHHQPGRLFPHVYGPLELSAVTRTVSLVRGAAGWRWP